MKKREFVTSTGHEILEVIDMDDDYQMIDVRCVIDFGGLYEPGETEFNLARRYSEINKKDYPLLSKIAEDF